MLALLNSLNAHNLPIFQSILMILISKFMIHRALSDKTYLSLGLLSPLKWSSFLPVNPVFPNLMVPLLFYQIQQAPGRNLRKTGKSLI